VFHVSLLTYFWLAAYWYCKYVRIPALDSDIQLYGNSVKLLINSSPRKSGLLLPITEVKGLHFLLYEKFGDNMCPRTTEDVWKNLSEQNYFVGLY